MKTVMLLMPLVFASCATTEKKIVVDVSAQRMTVMRGVVPIYTTKIETARNGIGHKKGSGKTPTGKFTVSKEKRHRYGFGSGPNRVGVLRLSGYQGSNRGILIHRDFRNGDGTSGCICPVDKPSMKRLWNLVNDGDTLIVNH